MLTAESSPLAHAAQNLVLIAFSLALLPFDTCILFLSYVGRQFGRQTHVRQRTLTRAHPDFQPKTVLVTGVGMTKGLALARLFHRAGHDVIGADFEPGGSLVCGRVSETINRFYRLEAPNKKSGSVPYIECLLNIVTSEQVDVWVSCSGVASAVEDGEVKEVIEARTKCKAIQFDVRTTQMLHEKHSFIERTRELGLTVPETHEVKSRAAVEDILRDTSKGMKFIMKTIGVDDSVRGDMTLLPKESQQETSKHIARLRINDTTPWIIQQFVEGREYCTHSLVINGEIKAFVACPSAELLMHYQALPASSPLSKAMLSFTKTFAEKSGYGFTGHLSFDFLVEYGDVNKEDSEEITLYPIECNPRAHTAVALFGDTLELANAYMSVLEAPYKSAVMNGADASDSSIVRPGRNDKYYWTGHDIFTLIVVPLFELVTFRISMIEFIRNLDLLADHLLTWKDGTYEIWDPLPWWWLYHIYWPLRFFDMLRQGRKWSRINISTCKVFEC